MKRLTLSLTLLAFASPALANWTGTGCFVYEDRPEDSTGFTGAIVQVPVRNADMEIIDANKSGNKATRQKGKTGDNGCFSLAVTVTSTRTIYVRALTSSTQTTGLLIKVAAPGGAVYALKSANIANHGPNTNVMFGTL